MNRSTCIICLLSLLTVWAHPVNSQSQKDSSYYAKMREPGVKMIPVYNGKYKVFTQKRGDGKTPLLLLHGGPENTHEYFENFPLELKGLDLSIYYYDQLGSYFSDTPDDPSIWNIPRLVEEVEEVRKGLGLDTMILLGHSWGGMLAELYAAKYGSHLKALILSNVPGFMAGDSKPLQAIIDSIDRATKYKATQLPQFQNNRMQADSVYRGLPLSDSAKDLTIRRQFRRAADSLFGHTLYYNKPGPMPEPLARNMGHLRFESIEKYGFDAFKADYTTALSQITVPTLFISGKNDFIRPEGYASLRKLMTKAKTTIAICPTGSHFNMWDDAECYFSELRKFIYRVR